MSLKQVVMENNGQIPEDLVSASLRGRGNDDMEKASNVFDTAKTLKSINELPQTVGKVKTVGAKIGKVFKGSKAATSTVEAGHSVQTGLKAGKGIAKILPKLGQALGGKGAVAAGETVATGAGGGSGLLGGVLGSGGATGGGTILGGLFGGGGAAAGGTTAVTAGAAGLSATGVGLIVVAAAAIGFGIYRGVKHHNEKEAAELGVI